MSFLHFSLKLLENCYKEFKNYKAKKGNKNAIVRFPISNFSKCRVQGLDIATLLVGRPTVGLKGLSVGTRRMDL